MGQQVLGILLGFKPSKKLQEILFTEDMEGLADHWNKMAGHRRIEQVFDSHGVPKVVGMWIAIQTGDKGVPDIDDPISFEAVRSGSACHRALLVWTKFVDWAKKKEVGIPTATLFIAPTEVA